MPVFGAALFCLFGPLLWAIHFGVLYLAHHIVCTVPAARGWPIDTIVLAATAVVVAALLLAGLMPQGLARLTRAQSDRPTDSPTDSLAGSLAGSASQERDGAASREILGGFMQSCMRLLALLSAFGVIWAGTAVLVIDSCGR